VCKGKIAENIRKKKKKKKKKKGGYNTNLKALKALGGRYHMGKFTQKRNKERNGVYSYFHPSSRPSFSAESPLPFLVKKRKVSKSNSQGQ